MERKIKWKFISLFLCYKMTNVLKEEGREHNTPFSILHINVDIRHMSQLN